MHIHRNYNKKNTWLNPLNISLDIIVLIFGLPGRGRGVGLVPERTWQSWLACFAQFMAISPSKVLFLSLFLYSFTPGSHKHGFVEFLLQGHTNTDLLNRNWSTALSQLHLTTPSSWRQTTTNALTNHSAGFPPIKVLSEEKNRPIFDVTPTIFVGRCRRPTKSADFYSASA